MKTKETKMKISLKSAIIISIFIILLIFIIISVFFILLNKKNNDYQENVLADSNHFHIENNNGKDYYIIDDEYTGECQILNVSLEDKIQEKYKDTPDTNWTEDILMSGG